MGGAADRASQEPSEVIDPIYVTFEVGKNAYQQPITLVRLKDTAGRYVWELRRGPADQRDDRSNVGGLTSDQVVALAAIVQDFEKGAK